MQNNITKNMGNSSEWFFVQPNAFCG